MDFTNAELLRGSLLPNSATRASGRWRLSLIWLFCTPGIVVLAYCIFAAMGMRFNVGDSESQGWILLGVTLMLFPFLAAIAYAGFVLTALIGLVGFPVLRSDTLPKGCKIEAVIALAISLAASVWIHFVH